MKQLLAWTGSADPTITSEAVMAMAEKFNTGQEVCLQIPSARGVMQVKEGTSGSIVVRQWLDDRGAEEADIESRSNAWSKLTNLARDRVER